MDSELKELIAGANNWVIDAYHKSNDDIYNLNFKDRAFVHINKKLRKALELLNTRQADCKHKSTYTRDCECKFCRDCGEITKYKEG